MVMKRNQSPQLRISGGAGRFFEPLEGRVLLSAVMEHLSLKKHHGTTDSTQPTANSITAQALADTTPPTVTLTSPTAGALLGRTHAALAGIGGKAAGDNSTVTIKIYAGAAATGSPVQTLSTSLAASGKYSITADPLPQGVYTAQTSQSDTSNNTGTSSAVTFTLYDTIAGDANGDGTVNFADFVVLSNKYGQSLTGPANGDFNFDHTVNFADFVILSNQYGKIATPANALTPGSNFTEATPTPPTNGPGQAGATTKAIARWDVVQYQTFNNTLDLGIVAFNSTGIDHVSFSVNGGPWTNIYQMTLNPQTNVAEYWCTLNAAGLPDGQAEVRAIAYPKVGNARVLQGPVTVNGTRSLNLFANRHNTLNQQSLYVATTGNDMTGNGTAANPYATILRAVQSASAGATIYLQAGTYNFNPLPSGFIQNDRWITITPAPGVPRSSVIVRPMQNSLRVYHLALENLTLDAQLGSDITNAAPGSFGGVWTDPEFWIDNCSISSSLGKSHLPELTTIVDTFQWAGGYYTNSTIHDYPGRAIVADRTDLVRNVQITNIGDDAIDNPQLVVNTTIDNVIANDPSDHIDAIQYFTDHPDMNSITYNVKATRVDGQLLFGTILSPSDGAFSNVAVVNYLATSLSGPVSNPSASQIGGGTNVPCDNLVFYQITMPQQNFLFINDPGQSIFTNTFVEGCVFWRLYTPQSAGITITQSHIIDFANESTARPTGDFTTGDPGFVAAKVGGVYPPLGDFHLLANSILKGKVTTLRNPLDLDGVLRVAPGSIGVYE
jgi:hypothetical protein